MSHMMEPHWTSREHANSSNSRTDASREMYNCQTNTNSYREDFLSGAAYSVSASSYGHAPWPVVLSGESPQSRSPVSPTGTVPALSESQDDSYGTYYTIDTRESKVCHCGKVFRRPSDLT